MANPTPQNYSRRAGSGMPGRVRRSIDGNLESRQRFGSTVEVSAEGMLEVKLRPGGGLKMTKDGLMADPEFVGEKNRPPIKRISPPMSGATAADLREKLIEILDELQRTGNMRG